MSWSLNISGGDLNFTSGASGASIVTGRDKAFQDLRCALLEPMGSDPMHPEFGALLDGGQLPNGKVVDSFLGENVLSVIRVKEEVGRIIQNYMDLQKRKIDAENQLYGRSTLQDSEIVQTILSLEDRMFGSTKLVIQANLLMRNANTVTINQPI
jgi:hypothetical protein